MTPDQILNLTVPQLMAELGQAGGRPVSPEELRDRAAAARAATFDKVCNQSGLSPSQVAALPVVALAERMRAAGADRVDESRLRHWAAEYATSKR